MTTIETIAIAIAAILVFPSICRWLNRPALLYSAFLLLGVALGDFLKLDTHFMLDEIGKVGFILLLFMVGLEIDLPPVGTLRKSFPFVFTWLLVQIPLFILLSWTLGFGPITGLVAGAGINACSLGISYSLLESQKGAIDESSMKNILLAMVVLEILSLFILAVSEILCVHGWSLQIIFQSSSIFGFILIIRLFSGKIHQQFSRLIENAGRWKIHQILLILFTITMIGERLGLSAAKTGFFLGLFMSSATHRGIKFEDELQPIAQNVLIPLFFISLGSRISPSHLFPYILPAGILIGAILFGLRFVIFRWMARIEVPRRFFLLFCPNLTMVAVAAGILTEHRIDRNVIDLLLATGLLMTIGAAIMFPSGKTVQKDPGEIKNQETASSFSN